MTSTKMAELAAPSSLSSKKTLKNQAKLSESTLSALWKTKVSVNQANNE